MKGLESICLQKVYNLRTAWEKEPKKTFKLVNAMLDVLDRDGIYGTTVYLQAYDKSGSGPQILTAFNATIRELGLFSAPDQPPSSVTLQNLRVTLDWYGKHLAGDDGNSLLAEMAMRRLLTHLRFETKAK